MAVAYQPTHETATSKVDAPRSKVSRTIEDDKIEFGSGAFSALTVLCRQPSHTSRDGHDGLRVERSLIM